MFALSWMAGLRGSGSRDVPAAALEPVDAGGAEPRPVQEHPLRRGARPGAARHRPGQAGRALPRGPAPAPRRPAVDLHRPRGADRGLRQARAGLQAAPELRPAGGDDLAASSREPRPPVGRYLLRRLLLLAPVLLGRLGGRLPRPAPARRAIRPRSCWARRPPRRTSPACARRSGLDEPLPMQYVRWMGHVLQGDLGRSHPDAAAGAGRGADPLPGHPAPHRHRAPPLHGGRHHARRALRLAPELAGGPAQHGRRRSSARACRASGWGSC